MSSPTRLSTCNLRGTVEVDRAILDSLLLRAVFYNDSNDLGHHLGSYVCDGIRAAQGENREYVLGCATGSSTRSMAKEIRRQARDEGLSLENVVFIQCDEQYGVDPKDERSYTYWIQHELVEPDYMNVDPGNVFVPDGSIPPEQVEDYCAWFEEVCRKHPRDLQLLGVGPPKTLHLAYNEPGEDLFESRTRLVYLHESTRQGLSGDWGGYEKYIPKQGITQGIATIFEGSKEIVVILSSEGKAALAPQFMEEPLSEGELRAAPLLQTVCDKVVVALTLPAAANLKGFREPWSVGAQMDWSTKSEVVRAVGSLSQRTERSFSKLRDEDFRANSLEGLLGCSDYQGRDSIVEIAGNHYRSIICADAVEEKPSNGKPICVYVQAPHPDDDVISMGGTIAYEVALGNEVHVNAFTSGNIAVWRSMIRPFTRSLEEFAALRGETDTSEKALEQHRTEWCELIEAFGGLNSDPGLPRSVLDVAGLIRKRELLHGTGYLGVPRSNVDVLNLPFYETGNIWKANPTGEDIGIVKERISSIRPDRIYVAWDLADPHGTHPVCAEVLHTALVELLQDGEDWVAEIEIRLYRGAWYEYQPHEIDVAVPMTEVQLERVLTAIRYHVSQHPRPNEPDESHYPAVFPGFDPRPFVVRAEARKRRLGAQFSEMGYGPYAAMEGFRQVKLDTWPEG